MSPSKWQRFGLNLNVLKVNEFKSGTYQYIYIDLHIYIELHIKKITLTIEWEQEQLPPTHFS